ncbi:penicillin-binding protein activator LpoB [Alteromonas aestuariivivens]|uniref:Penicillin-binding protein activator LpoB n=1 Tax=Alteromonas aestuariivivens TaxID=1938339 RepID=A0A3D8MDV1_9ALTE|nr:penicillin-binding protein activator LpoB [Alteromonas aestuariivivens]RDV28037.1 penicillin-binding protein activator LpoB [Alteromonas aestuariivivens]
MNKIYSAAAVTITLLATGCASNSKTYDNAAGRNTIYEDVSSTSSTVAGIGVESQDVVSMTDQMMRDMLQNPMLVSNESARRIIIDSEYLVNESTSRINKNMLTDRLRINLNRAANGRMVFVGRHFSDMVNKERELKRSGVVDAGTIRTTQATAGADFRLGGRISSLDAMDTNTQLKSRYHQVTFEMVDLELGTIVWSGIYEFKKTAQDDIVYR